MHQSLRLILIGLTLLGTASVALADDLIVNTFDTGISGIDWQNFRSYIYGYNEVWDGSQDAAGNPNSGSMYLTINWPLASDPTGTHRGTTCRLPSGRRRSIRRLHQLRVRYQGGRNELLSGAGWKLRGDGTHHGQSLAECGGLG